MPVQPGEHTSSSTGTTQYPVELQCCIPQDGMRRKPAATAKSLPPSQLDTISQKAKSQTICDGPLPTTARLSRVFSFPQLGTNTNKSTNIIPVIPTQSDSIIVSSRSKRLVRKPSRNPSRHLSSMSTFAQTSSSQHATPFTTLPRPPSMCVTDVSSKRPTNKTSCSLPISDEDETDEESDDTVARYRKIRQLQMARLAKLTRHLGEDIPPELVLSSTIPTDILESRSLVDSLSIHSSKDHRRWRSLDPTEDSQSAPALPSSCTLRKSRSLRDTEGVLRLQTRSEHAVNAVDGKFPYAFHPPQTEADLLQHSQPTGCIAASINGHDDVYHSLMSTPNALYGSQDSLQPLPPTSLPTSTPKRSQFHGNPVASELTLDKISNMECREEKPDKFLGVGINPESISPTDRSLYPTDVAVDISHSLTQISPCSQLEVKVQISKRTRFWRMKFGKDVVQTLQSTNPGDIAKQLREMKASI